MGRQFRVITGTGRTVLMTIQGFSAEDSPSKHMTRI